MRRTALTSEEKRLTLRLSQTLWRQLRLEAARRDVSTTLLINQFLEERLGHLRRMELEPILRRVQALGNREADWNGYGALPPEPQAVTFAESWLAALYQQVEERGALWLAPHVTSSAEGEVVFEWWNDPKKLTVYCTAEDASYLKSWGPDMITEMQEGDAATPEAREQLWSWLMDKSANG
jgi:hypothetical protein